MAELNERKTLVITGLHEKSHPLLPAITNKPAEQLFITSSFGTVISQPYGCTIRNIIMAVYAEGIEEIYIIGERDSKEHSVNGEEILSKIQAAGISSDIIQTIEYINVVGDNLLDWLVGKQDVKAIIEESVDLIKNHPLIPKTLPVHGFVVSTETGEFEAV